MSNVTPGWYKDPAEPTTQRYWDGDGWVGGSLPLDATPPEGPLTAQPRGGDQANLQDQSGVRPTTAPPSATRLPSTSGAGTRRKTRHRRRSPRHRAGAR